MHKDYTGLDNESESWPKVVKKYNEMFDGNYNAGNIAFSKSLEMWGNYSELQRFLHELSSLVLSSKPIFIIKKTTLLKIKRVVFLSYYERILMKNYSVLRS